MKPYRVHLLLGLSWLIVGMLLGEHMGRSGDHGQMPTHAHIMLLGGVLPIVFSLVYKTFGLTTGLLAWIQVGIHHAAALVMIVSLYMLYGDMGSEATLGPVLGIAALGAILSVVLMLWMSLRARAD